MMFSVRRVWCIYIIKGKHFLEAVSYNLNRIHEMRPHILTHTVGRIAAASIHTLSWASDVRFLTS